MAGPLWKPLEDILSRYRDVGRRAQFWLRDDDAIEPTPALDRLLALTERSGVPVAVAVIPASMTRALPERLASDAHATALVHGWSHANHAAPGEKQQELGPHRPTETIVAELTRALQAVRAAFGLQSCPVLVPPWNRIDLALLPHLKAIGFSAVSTSGKPRSAPLPFVNATVDVIDWRGTRGCRDHEALVGEIVVQLRDALDSHASVPVGILTHHLVHDERAWTFLQNLFEMMSVSSTCDWRAIADLVASAERP